MDFTQSRTRYLAYDNEHRSTGFTQTRIRLVHLGRHHPQTACMLDLSEMACHTPSGIVKEVLQLCSNLGVQVLPDKMQSLMQFECKCPEYRTRGLG